MSKLRPNHTKNDLENQNYYEEERASDGILFVRGEIDIDSYKLR